MYRRLSLTLLFLSLTATTALAINMSSPEYKIQMSDLNMTSGRKSSASYTVTDTLGQLGPGKYSGTNYIVRSGFQYIYSLYPFSFSISNLEIAFGSLSLNNLQTQTNTLTVSFPAGYGYTVTAAETQPMTLVAGSATIPDTTCDAGGCTEVTAAAWTQTSTYGFGYNAAGNDVPSEFTGSTIYKQFANLASSETPQAVMSSTEAGKNRAATITYQINVGSSQTAGDYQTLIVYSAIPSY